MAFLTLLIMIGAETIGGGGMQNKQTNKKKIKRGDAKGQF